MASITVRNLDDELKQRLRLRAAQHGRSMEEEVRQNIAYGTIPTICACEQFGKRYSCPCCGSGWRRARNASTRADAQTTQNLTSRL